MNVLLSIKPKYVDLILNGEKKYEFRRKIFRNETNKVYVYCTSPVKKNSCLFHYSSRQHHFLKLQFKFKEFKCTFKSLI